MEWEGTMQAKPSWWAKGHLYENCNCRLICRCHISYRQPADHERCLGFLAVRIDEGAFGDVSLAEQQAVLLVDAPQIMTEPDWTVGLCIDERADAGQRDALERILFGQAGGGWAALGALMARRLETRFVPITIQQDGHASTIRVDGVMAGELTAGKGADKENPPRLENLHNQVHGTSQVLAWGSFRYEPGMAQQDTADTHGLWSRFSWRVP